MNKNKKIIEEYFKKYPNYYSFYSSDEQKEKENRGCFGLLKYGNKNYFALSGALGSRNKFYNSRNEVIKEIKKEYGYRYTYAPLKENSVTFYSKFKETDGGKGAKELNKGYLINEGGKDFLTLADFLNPGQTIDDYLNNNNNTLFNCVERMLIANAEDDFTVFRKKKEKTIQFIIKWKPCVKCKKAVYGKKVLYYYENFKKFKEDYIAGKLKLKKFKS